MILYLSDRGKRKMRRGDGRASVPEKARRFPQKNILRIAAKQGGTLLKKMVKVFRIAHTREVYR